MKKHYEAPMTTVEMLNPERPLCLSLIGGDDKADPNKPALVRPRGSRTTIEISE